MAESPTNKISSNANARTATQVQAAADANRAAQHAHEQQEARSSGQTQMQSGDPPIRNPDGKGEVSAAQQAATLPEAQAGPPPPLQNQGDSKSAPK